MKVGFRYLVVYISDSVYTEEAHMYLGQRKIRGNMDSNGGQKNVNEGHGATFVKIGYGVQLEQEKHPHSSTCLARKSVQFMFFSTKDIPIHIFYYCVPDIILN